MLREQGVGQAEAVRLVGIGRTLAWALDKEFGLNAKTEPKAPSSEQVTPPSSDGVLREHLERDVASNVLPAGVAESFDHDPDDPRMPDPTERAVPNEEPEAPVGGMVMGVGASIRGLFGTRVGPDEPFPAPTSGDVAGSAVRLHVGRELPSDIDRFARLTSWR